MLNTTLSRWKDQAFDWRAGTPGRACYEKRAITHVSLAPSFPLVHFSGILTNTVHWDLSSAYFSQHHVDTLTPTVSPVSFLASKFPGKSEQEYRSHLGSFGITGLTGMQVISTLSGGQKSRVAFAALSLQMPHVLLLDEVSSAKPLFVSWNSSLRCSLILAYQSLGY